MFNYLIVFSMEEEATKVEEVKTEEAPVETQEAPAEPTA